LGWAGAVLTFRMDAAVMVNSAMIAFMTAYSIVCNDPAVGSRPIRAT
jgi:hypothetical protein